MRIPKQLKVFILGVVLLLSCSGAAHAADPDDVMGVWLNQEKDGKIEIYRCGDVYCGRIVWLKEPNYPEDSKEGIPGSQKLDHHNPKQSMRSRPVLGLQIMEGFRFAGDNRWRDGRIYDPKTGKTYRGKITLSSPDQLDLRGYIGISLIGRTSTWTR